MVQFEDHETVSIVEADAPGQNFRRVTRTVGRRENGNDFDFISYKKGYIREPDDGGDPEEIITDSFSLGDPQYMTDLISALGDLRKEVYDQ